MFQRPYYYPRQSYHHYNQEVNPFPHQPFYENPPNNGHPVHQTPYEYFAKPLQPSWPDMMQGSQNQYGNPGNQVHPGNQASPGNQFNPGNQGNYTPQPPMNPVNSLMSNFQNQDGKVDIDKMLGTVGQMANTYHQVSPIFKQFGTFLKGFR